MWGLHNKKGEIFLRREIPIWEKSNLTLEEAAAYSGIGINKLRNLTESEQCSFVLWNGTRPRIKRQLFEKFVDEKLNSI